MSTGPYGTPPEIPGYPGPATPPPADAPPPYWQAPGTPGAPPPRPARHLGAIIAVIVIVLVVVGSVVGYVIVGLAYGQSRLDGESTAYNTVIDHLNTLNDTVTSVKTKLDAGAVSSTTATSIAQDKSLVDQFVTASQTAQTEIATDDASLASADASLKDNQWLTTLSRSRLDRASTRIGHVRAAHAAAKTITTDYVQRGGFFQALYALGTDLQTLGSKSSAKDLTGAAAADVAVTADVAKAIQLDKAPGLSVRDGHGAGRYPGFREGLRPAPERRRRQRHGRRSVRVRSASGRQHQGPGH